MEMQLAVAAVRLSVARPFVKGWDKNGVGVKAIRKFLPKNSKGYRLYIPIKKTKADRVVVPSAVFHAIHEAGYSIEDYINGIAVAPDGKRRVRIGKLLRDAEAIKEFANDPQRSAHKDEYTCVISAHPYDVIGMSTGRRWDKTTCMRLATPENKGDAGEKAVEFMPGTVAEGTLVAYVISPKDKNINKPHARLLIKPFKKADDQSFVYFKVETAVYGQPIPGFKRTVENWLKRVNKGAQAGIYKLHKSVHIDRSDDLRTAIIADYEKVDDKDQFILKNMYPAGGPKVWLNADKRWLPDMLRVTTDPHNLEEIVNAARGAGIHANKIGAIYDQVIPADDMRNYDLSEFLLGTHAQELFETSKHLGAAAREQFEWTEDEETNAEHAMKYGLYDSRWLSSVTDISPDLLRQLAQKFIYGAYRWTPELQASKLRGAKHIRLYLAFVANGLLADTGWLTQRVDIRNLKNYVKRSKIPASWDEEIVDLIKTINWNANFRNSTTNSINGEACVLNVAPDWAAVFPEWIPESRRFLSEKAVGVLAKMARHNKTIRDQLVYWAYSQNRDALANGYTWFAVRKNVRDFIHHVAAQKGDDEAITFAQRIMSLQS
jgi:hypothetical protein